MPLPNIREGGALTQRPLRCTCSRLPTPFHQKPHSREGGARFLTTDHVPDTPTAASSAHASPLESLPTTFAQLRLPLEPGGPLVGRSAEVRCSGSQPATRLLPGLHRDGCQAGPLREDDNYYTSNSSIIFPPFATETWSGQNDYCSCLLIVDNYVKPWFTNAEVCVETVWER